MKTLEYHTKEQIFVIFSLLIVLVTNVYPDFLIGLTTLGQGDTESYRDIALFAPNLPDHVIVYQQAQRFFLPYFLGVISKLSGFPLEPLFRLVNLVLFLTIVFIFYRTLKDLNLPRWWLSTICILVFFNPYVSRYPLSLHFMVNSLLFVFGFLLICKGFILNQKTSVLLGLGIAALGRQTALLLLPVVWFWFYFAGYRKDKKLSTVYMLIFVSLFALLAYVIGGMFASALGGKNINIYFMTGIFDWFQNFNLQKIVVLIEFLVRGFMAHAWIVSLFLTWYILNDKPKLGSKFWFLVLLSISVCIQPILGGPVVTGNNLVRLLAISNLGLAMAFAVVLQNKRCDLSWRFLVFIFILCMIGSMHHRWSLVGGILFLTPFKYAILFYTVTILIVLSYWVNEEWGLRDSDKVK
jgi:hypothetical protein